MSRRSLTPLRAARADALADYIRRCGYGKLVLNDLGWLELRARGFTRSEVNRAVDDLVKAGAGKSAPS